MALHRDIYWVGRQWAVTGYGVQACDQKQKSAFDIEAGRLWEEGLLESVRALKWLDAGDFDKALSVARVRFPQPRQPIAVAQDATTKPEQAKKAVDPLPKTAVEGNVTNFAIQGRNCRARLLVPWRIRWKQTS